MMRGLLGMRMSQRTSILLLLGVLIAQVVLHLVWFSVYAFSAQVAVPWMMNNGRTLFGDLLDQHAPGSSFVVAAVQRISPFAIIDTVRILNLLLVLAVTIMVYVVASRLGDEASFAGVATVLVWAWWKPIYGNTLFYFDSIVGALLLLAVLIWMLLENSPYQSLAFLAIGLVLGGATVFKQHAWVAVALFGAWLVVSRPRNSVRRDVVLYSVGVVVFPLLLILVVVWYGVFDGYFYWNWTYNLNFGEPRLKMPGRPPDSEFLRKFILTVSLVPAFLLLGLREARRDKWLLIGVMWVAGCMLLFPRVGGMHMMGQLPLLAVMSGVVLARIVYEIRDDQSRKQLQRVLSTTRTLAGVLLSLSLAWGVSGIGTYRPHDIRIRGFDEFKPLAQALNEWSVEGDTLFVLPELDDTPQLHVLSGLMPPKTWVTGWYWFLTPDVVDRLLSEWKMDAPDFIVLFPRFVEQNKPEITPLLEFADTHYEEIGRVESVPFHGDAIILKLRTAND